MSEGTAKPGMNWFRLGLFVTFGLGLCFLLMPIVDVQLNPLVGFGFSGLMFVGGLVTATCAQNERFRKAGWLAAVFGLPFMIAAVVVLVMAAGEAPPPISN
jgi:hypothetical protein